MPPAKTGFRRRWVGPFGEPRVDVRGSGGGTVRVGRRDEAGRIGIASYVQWVGERRNRFDTRWCDTSGRQPEGRFRQQSDVRAPAMLAGVGWLG